MRRFELHRDTDPTGVSGTGVVAEGVESRHGRVALFWLPFPRSIVVWDSIDDALRIHGHDGHTGVVWLD